ncbi:MAG TPA: hypothetical protein DEB31_01295, partial [Clostridiales bacterium]|nr:hypothetical protein [Clostridiales bacterium]
MGAEELKKILDTIGGDGELTGALTREKAEVYREQNKAALFYRTTAHFMPARFLGLKKKLDGLSTDVLAIRASQAAFARELFEDNGMLEQCCK